METQRTNFVKGMGQLDRELVKNSSSNKNNANTYQGLTICQTIF